MGSRGEAVDSPAVAAGTRRAAAGSRAAVGRSPDVGAGSRAGARPVAGTRPFETGRRRLLPGCPARSLRSSSGPASPGRRALRLAPAPGQTTSGPPASVRGPSVPPPSPMLVCGALAPRAAAARRCSASSPERAWAFAPLVDGIR